MEVLYDITASRIQLPYIPSLILKAVKIFQK